MGKLEADEDLLEFLKKYGFDLAHDLLQKYSFIEFSYFQDNQYANYACYKYTIGNNNIYANLMVLNRVFRFESDRGVIRSGNFWFFLDKLQIFLDREAKVFEAHELFKENLKEIEKKEQESLKNDRRGTAATLPATK